jgi:SPP1 family predicted phage head-tail adaptor
MAAYGSPPAGAMRERVSIIAPSTTPDGYGGTSGPATTVLSGFAARITPQMRGTEQLLAQGLQATALYTVWVRSTSETRTITENMSVQDDRTGTIYNIRLIANPDERGRFLCMFCERGVAP